jgi:beta-xylosidase
VNTKTGEDWFLHFQDKDAYGRVVHLQPMKWLNDWPVIGVDKDADGKGEPVMVYKKPHVVKTYPISSPAESDEFNSPKPGLQWQWQANPQGNWAFPTSNGSLRMFSVYQPDSINNLWNLPNILTQKLPAEEFVARLKVTFNPKFKNERFGLVMLGADYAYISLEKGDDGIYIVCKENFKADKNNGETGFAEFPVKGNEFYLEIMVEKGGICHFRFSDNEERITTVSKSFTAKPGRWVGAKIGMFCLRNNITNDAGFADVDWFRIEPVK